MDVTVREAGPEALADSPTFLQSAFWGRFKEGFGWKARFFVVESGAVAGQLSPASCGLLVMERSLYPGLRFAYVPHGPAVDLSQEELDAWLEGLASALKPLLPASTLFLRFDPPWYEVEAVSDSARPDGAGGDEVVPAGLRDGEPPAAAGASDADTPAAVANAAAATVSRPVLGRPFRHAAADIQPPDTVLLDLSAGEAAVLEGMKPKWRYNIRLAEKKGVTVSETRASGDWQPALSKFYELYRETSERDHIALHPESYYRALFEFAAREGQGCRRFPDLRVWTASHEGEALAAIITIFWGSQAVYLYGASSNVKRNLMPAYALQWAAIRAAMEAGCSEYDFYGIPPTDDPGHPMAGLYRFKTGFGGKIVHRAGSWDYPLRPVAYSAFRAAESARTWYFKDFRKRKHGKV
jgi:lipid II:glycine glycyltransferase (peptidoglycan interpeptide bridge formation enzyme)